LLLQSRSAGNPEFALSSRYLDSRIWHGAGATIGLEAVLGAFAAGMVVGLATRGEMTEGSRQFLPGFKSPKTVVSRPPAHEAGALHLETQRKG
jgi:hypothetical protein